MLGGGQQTNDPRIVDGDAISYVRAPGASPVSFRVIGWSDRPQIGSLYGGEFTTEDEARVEAERCRREGWYGRVHDHYDIAEVTVLSDHPRRSSVTVVILTSRGEYDSLVDERHREAGYFVPEETDLELPDEWFSGAVVVS